MIYLSAVFDNMRGLYICVFIYICNVFAYFYQQNEIILEKEKKLWKVTISSGSCIRIF